MEAQDGLLVRDFQLHMDSAIGVESHNRGPIARTLSSFFTNSLTLIYRSLSSPSQPRDTGCLCTFHTIHRRACQILLRGSNQHCQQSLAVAYCENHFYSARRLGGGPANISPGICNHIRPLLRRELSKVSRVFRAGSGRLCYVLCFIASFNQGKAKDYRGAAISPADCDPPDCASHRRAPDSSFATLVVRRSIYRRMSSQWHWPTVCI